MGVLCLFSRRFHSGNEKIKMEMLKMAANVETMFYTLSCIQQFP